MLALADQFFLLVAWGLLLSFLGLLGALLADWLGANPDATFTQWLERLLSRWLP